MASRATTTILLLLATTAAISTANVDAAKRSARRPMASPSSVRGGGGGSKSRSLKSSSTLPAKRAASLHSMPSRPVGAAVKRSSSKLSKSSTSSSTPAATISAAADATRKKRAASLCSPSRSSVGAGVNKRSPLPAPETCVSSLLDLSPCLAFFKDASATAAPAGCCAGLRTIIDTQPVCLCHIVNHTLERAIGVDIPVDRALTLLGDICRLAPPQEILTCADKGAVPPLYACPAPSV